jgi:hypothetical protein
VNTQIINKKLHIWRQILVPAVASSLAYADCNEQIDFAALKTNRSRQSERGSPRRRCAFAVLDRGVVTDRQACRRRGFRLGHLGHLPSRVKQCAKRDEVLDAFYAIHRLTQVNRYGHPSGIGA